MTDDQKADPVNVQRSERRERADRILDAVTELVLRHGYRRVTIEDVAVRAGIGKGTIYLHWRTREALFYAALARESVALLDELVTAMRDDPGEIRPHRAMRLLLRRSMERPLVAAMATRDTEILGKLVDQNAMETNTATIELNGEYLKILRAHGIVRTDLDELPQLYATEVIGGGFTLLEPWLPPMLNLPLETKVDTVAHVLRVVLEPEQPPSPAVLAKAAPSVIEKFERMRQLFLDAVYGTDSTTETGESS